MAVCWWIKIGWLCLCIPSICTPLFAVNQWISFSGVYPVVNTAADKTTDAIYYRKHSTNSVIGAFTYGVQATNSVYTGIRYEYWASDRKYDLGQDSYNHRLNYQTAGLEVGYSFFHPRVWWAVVGGAHYPIKASSSGFVGSTVIQYQARTMLGIRTSKTIWILLETGWRWANLGTLTDGSSSYVEGNGSMDLSGALVSFGILFNL